MKFAASSVAALLVASVLLAGCRQAEALLGKDDSRPDGSSAETLPEPRGPRPVLPSNPLPAVPEDATATASQGEAAPAQGDTGPSDLADRAPPSKNGLGRRLYTAHNLWYENADAVDSRNFKVGRMLPAGTEVAHVEVVSRRFEQECVKFTTRDTVMSFRILFDSKNHPGWTLDQLKERMITDQSFEDLTDGLAELEIEAIRAGMLRAGMSRRAVLIAYGDPPALSTPDLEADLWRYWISPSRYVSLRFDASGRLLAAPKVEQTGS